MKRFSIISILVLLIGLVALNTAAAYTVQELDVNGVEASADTIVYAERGDSIDIRIELLGASIDEDDVRVKTWIGGYEYGDVEDKTSIFDIKANAVHVKELRLEVPEDIEEDDYTLHVEAYDDNGNSIVASYVYTLRIEGQRHDLGVIDVVIRPSGSVQAGRALFVSARVENLGQKKEEDIRVRVSIPELGVSGITYIDELTENEIDNEDEEDSASSDEVYLLIPTDAKTGDYEVKVEVEYNRGHDVISKTKVVHVEGSEETAQGIVSVDSSSKTVKAGEEVAYRIMIANLGKTKAVYSAEVSGEESWASARVDPGFVTVNADESAEILVYVKANENADDGQRMFTIKVKSGDAVVKDVNVSADVEESGSIGLRRGLQIGFAILVIILIVLGLIVAFRKSSEEPLEPSETGSEKSYY